MVVKTWIQINGRSLVRFKTSLSLSFLINKMEQRTRLNSQFVGIVLDNANEFLIEGLLAPGKPRISRNLTYNEY